VRLAHFFLPILALAIAACPGSPPPKPPPAHGAMPRTAPPEKVEWRMSKSGLGFRLSNADAEKPSKNRLVAGKRLAANVEKQVLARMPGFKAQPEVKTVALRAKSIPAPRPGETIKSTFPPPVTRPVPAGAGASGPLQIVRHAPDGDVEVAPNLALSFSEPMVAVTSHGELAKAELPVRLTPETPGHWRWVGSQTLFFEPAGERFPASTSYQVEIPTTTRAASGHTLGSAERFSFATPTLRVKSVSPNSWQDPVDLDPTIFLELNQRIDQRALVSHIELRTDKNRKFAVRLASSDEIEKDDTVRELSHAAEPERWIALKSVEPLPLGSVVSIVLEAGAPSAEGPRTTENDWLSSFRVRGPLRLESASCGWSEGCPPLAPFSVLLSNTIDASEFRDDMVKVDPPIPALSMDVSGRVLTLRGRTKGRTKYTIDLSGEIRDVFGQNLEQPAKASIDVTEAEPMLFPEQDDMMVLDPAFEPKLSVYSVNERQLRVKLYAVRPSDWDDYQRFRHDYDWDGRVTAPPGRLLKTSTVSPKGERDSLLETRIDLGRALKAGFGQVLVIVEPPVQPKPRNRWDYRSRVWVRAWVQVTKLGLTAFRGDDEMYAWVTDLATGSAVSGANVSLPPAGPNGKTGNDGLARLELNSGGAHLIASRGDDMVFVPGGKTSSVFEARPKTNTLRWFVFDDRHLYKPGERVNVKGWVRLHATGKNGDLGRLSSSYRRKLEWKVRDPRGADLAKGETTLDDMDGFSLAFDLPKNANLGDASVLLDLGGWDRQYGHSFQIQEFRRPEFEVSADVSDGPWYVGKHAIATVRAKYFAGGGLADAEVNWQATAEDAYFTPPNREQYHFGKPRRWSWWSANDDKEARRATSSWKSKTDAEGKHRLRIDFDALDPAYPRQISLEASVSDVNRQSWTARTSVLVHPANVMVGLREQSQLLHAGADAQVDVIVTDVEGKNVSGAQVSLASARIEQTWRGNKMIETERDPESCNVTSADEAQHCTFPMRSGGLHRITAKVKDAFGRASQTQIELWVLGADPPENPNVRRDRVEMIPDKKEYAAGETAEILVAAPFAPAEAVLSLRRDGIVHLERFRLEKKTQTVRVKLDAAWVPNVVAAVDLVGARERENESGAPDASLPKRPAAASGDTTLTIPPKDRTLDIRIKPAKKALEPGGSTTISLDVSDASGHPVPNASLALVVVDESVLALAGYDLPDPIEVFYPPRGAGVQEFETRLRVALMRPNTARMSLQPKAQKVRAPLTLNPYSGVGAGGGGRGEGVGLGSIGVLGGDERDDRTKSRAKAEEGRMQPAPAASAAPEAPTPKPPAKKAEGKGKQEPQTPIKMRENFDALAAFVPRITSDGRGHAAVKVKLPDNLTRYRVMAVAAEGKNRFGKGESDVTARLPLMVRPSAPRFLNFGDKFSLPVVLQNQTANALSVDVVARGANLKFFEPHAVRVEVPANDRVEVRFPAAAGEPGTARFQVGAVSSAGDDASELELPIWTPATTEAFATYGQIDKGAIAQPVKMPSGVYTELGDLEITTSSTALQGLTDAVLYLVRYPFECNEQIASRMLAIAALKDVLGAFKAEGLPPKKALVATVAADLEKLAQRQHYSGGWDWWRKDHEPDPFVSVHVSNALAIAKKKGFVVPPALVGGAQNYLRNIVYHFPPWYTPEEKRTVRAYALFVRDELGDNVAAEARKLFAEGKGVTGTSMDAIGWLLPILSKSPDAGGEVAAIRRSLDNKIAETAGKAHFVTHVSDSAHVTLESSRRTDGILLNAMIIDRPDSDAIPKIAQGLLAHRKRGHWYNTQENVFILLALDRYFSTYEKVTPDFVARAWLGDRLAAEHAFKGRSVDRQQVEIPLSYLASERSGSKVTLQKDGDGRLYFRIGMQYVPKDLRPPPLEAGFSVSRLYEGVDSPSDVTREKDGTWRVKLGSRVRIRLAMVAPGRRYHVALVDPIPAGFEAMNPALAMTGSVPRDPNAASSKNPWWWSSVWYEHQNMRDERVEAFTSLLYGGVYDYSYVARATTPGDFVVPPPKAEEMYDPETFGRGPGDRVVIR
jgi:alpha-2-macroglobulin